MKKLIENLKIWLENWQQSRYGMDEFSNLLLCVSAALVSGSILLRKFTVYPLIILLAAAPGIWAIARCLSRNISGHKQENDTYLKIRDEIVYRISLRKKPEKFENPTGILPARIANADTVYQEAGEKSKSHVRIAGKRRFDAPKYLRKVGGYGSLGN